MSEPRIGRVLVASLHQAIADILPTRLEFYENWLNVSGLREGTIGLAPLSAVLSFLRTEGPAYDLITTRAGEYAADWTIKGLAPIERRVIRALPAALRARAALRTARALVRVHVSRVARHRQAEARHRVDRPARLAVLRGPGSIRAPALRFLRLGHHACLFPVCDSRRCARLRVPRRRQPEGLPAVGRGRRRHRR